MHKLEANPNSGTKTARQKRHYLLPESDHAAHTIPADQISLRIFEVASNPPGTCWQFVPLNQNVLALSSQRMLPRHGLHIMNGSQLSGAHGVEHSSGSIDVVVGALCDARATRA